MVAMGVFFSGERRMSTEGDLGGEMVAMVVACTWWLTPEATR